MAASKNGSSTDSTTDLLAEAEAAEAEAAAAEAAAAEARARAKAVALRRKAEAEQAEPDTESEDAEDAEDLDNAEEPGDDTPRATRRLRSPGWNAVAAGLGVLALVALLVLSGAMMFQHREAVQREQRAADFAAAARQGVINLMSLNFNSAETDLQRVIDSTTGSFRDDFKNSAKDFMTVMSESKVVTTSEVKATGVKSMDDSSAVVLVAATSQVSNTASKEPTPRAWRLSVTVNKEDDGIKMSKVEFVP